MAKIARIRLRRAQNVGAILLLGMAPYYFSRTNDTLHVFCRWSSIVGISYLMRYCDDIDWLECTRSMVSAKSRATEMMVHLSLPPL